MGITEDLTLTDSELNRMGEVLVEADRIRNDDTVYRAVCNHMKNKAGKINRIADLRDKMASDDLEDKQGNNAPNRVEYEG